MPTHPHPKYRSLAPPSALAQFLASAGYAAPADHAGLLESLGRYYREDRRPFQVHARTRVAGHMCETLANSAKPRFILLCLHGMNANPSDFKGFGADVLREASARRIGMAVVIPYAFKDASMNAEISRKRRWDHGGYRWWDLLESDGGVMAKLKGAVDTLNGEPPELPGVCKEIQRVVDEACCVLRVPDSCVAVMGFSMGAMLTSDLIFSLRTPPIAAGIFSGMEVFPKDHDVFFESLAADRRRYRACVSVFQAHSKGDFIVPYLAGSMLRDHLKALGFGADTPAEFETFDGGHTIDEECLTSFLRVLFAAIERGPAAVPPSLRDRAGVVPLVKKKWDD